MVQESRKSLDEIGMSVEQDARLRTVTVNGDKVASRARTLAALLAELNYGEKAVATALNGDFIALSDRATTQLSDGDRIEIVSARQGG